MNAEASRTRRTTAMMTPTAERRGSSAATADGLEVELSAVTLARFFAAALRCDARAAAPASLAAAFTKRRRRRSKNVAVTA